MGFFASVFLGYFGGEACDPAQDKEEFPGFGREAGIIKNRPERTVNIDGKRFDFLANRGVERFHEEHAVSCDTFVARHGEENRDTGIDGVNTVDHAGQASFGGFRAVYDLACSFGEGKWTARGRTQRLPQS